MRKINLPVRLTPAPKGFQVAVSLVLLGVAVADAKKAYTAYVELNADESVSQQKVTDQKVLLITKATQTVFSALSLGIVVFRKTKTA